MLQETAWRAPQTAPVQRNSSTTKMISSIESDLATPIAKMGRHVAANERQHHEDKNNYE